jgi:hypothetical protein
MRGAINSLGAGVLALVLAGCAEGPTAPATRPKGGAQKTESRKEDPTEVKWAQRMAEEFLENVKVKDYGQQKNLTTKSFQAAQPNNAPYRLETGVALKSWALTETVVSPDGREVTFKGTAQYALDGKKTQSGDWTILVQKDKDSGRWLVNYCRLARAPRE